ncbi:hypothetical protein [Thermus thermophilus HB8]|uniref:Uncharacterized protein n=1 Tax=Thermus thermophilus (strain ATCC 27634 / DSM 579 / HB8) TaxID=300852 RepID=Q5SJ63_THET8|nr:hypothetical protein [Thermus thermophilus HB8]
MGAVAMTSCPFSRLSPTRMASSASFSRLRLKASTPQVFARKGLPSRPGAASGPGEEEGEAREEKEEGAVGLEGQGQDHEEEDEEVARHAFILRQVGLLPQGVEPLPQGHHRAPVPAGQGGKADLGDLLRFLHVLPEPVLLEEAADLRVVEGPSRLFEER